MHSANPAKKLVVLEESSAAGTAGDEQHIAGVNIGERRVSAGRAGLKDLMARTGHDNARAAMIYQHAVRGADKVITGAIDKAADRA